MFKSVTLKMIFYYKMHIIGWALNTVFNTEAKRLFYWGEERINHSSQNWITVSGMSSMPSQQGN